MLTLLPHSDGSFRRDEETHHWSLSLSGFARLSLKREQSDPERKRESFVEMNEVENENWIRATKDCRGCCWPPTGP
ncbi:hypothetical protein [Cyclobacterium roseum]|uniref:hypothetical protein n=1 Tax=Cyclobacterium roseum TaxID=2666137 RepID=UPI001391775A|nr:hypothetical protein [Cyclobacterium roseum]